MRLLFCIFTLLFSLRPLCAKRPKIWQKKRCKRNCDKKNIEKKNKHGNFRVRARVCLCSPLLQREVDAVIPKKNNELVARHSLHAYRVLARARTLYFLKLCDCDICQFAKQVWSPPLLLYYYPPKNHTLWYSCQVVRIVWCESLLQRVISYERAAVLFAWHLRPRAQVVSCCACAYAGVCV